MQSNTVRRRPPNACCGLRLCAALLLGAAGCQNPVDALYDEPDPPSVAVLTDADVRATCEACATERCSEPRAACLDDVQCRALLACRGACGDPTCRQECTAEHGYSPWYDDLWSCSLIDECAQACNAGANFGCIDDYQAPRAEDASRFELRFRYKNPRTGLAYAYTGDERDEQFVVGAEARSCPPQDIASTQCQPIDEGTVDATNTFALDLIAHQVTRVFAGVVEVELRDQGDAEPDRFRQLGWRDRYFFPPLAYGSELRFYVYWRGWIRQAVLRETPDARLDFETAAPLAIYFEDCTGAPARGVRLEVQRAEEARIGVEVDVLNQLSDDTYGDETDTGSALAGDVPEPLRETAISVQAVEVSTERVLARRSDVFVRPGWTTHVWLTPRPER